ncbi:MAG: hypothetical protein PQ612_01415 [Rickettsiales bacterium]|nr:hypothetical protein [Pseudomonadota bacterium]MDA0965424.1 hypothetical protein [Pseudomonadota bacterium]MDG4542749.1 hypothetical protein [Rickettsiales bacterium]MDG4544803.1 hypothetical protein [Rickettsiales bacterium]MDG4546925.1 hypothetical protein [Rickettsiales bacterium]
MNRKIVVFLSVGLLFFTSEAFARCNKPSKPVCSSNDEIYKNKEAYKVCQAEIEAFHSSATKHIDCLKQELQVITQETQSKIDIVSGEANSIIKEFNCRSGSQEDC